MPLMGLASCTVGTQNGGEDGDVEGFAQVNQLFESRRPHSTGAQNPALCKRDNPETSTGLYLLQLSLHTAA
jgi:hypothetical protein